MRKRINVTATLFSMLVTGLVTGCGSSGEDRGADCTPGATRCVEADDAQQEVCTADGRAWVAEPCGDRMSCDLQANQCACEPGTGLCEAPGEPGRLVCAANGRSWVHADCSSSQVCSDADGRPLCKTRVCDAGRRTCEADQISFAECDAYGTSFKTSGRCAEDQACQNGECVVAPSRLGDVMQVRAADGTVALVPGYYAIAVVDAGSKGTDKIDFPVALTGVIEDSGDTETDSPMALSTRMMSMPVRSGDRSRTPYPYWEPARPGQFLREATPLYSVGDTRIFNYPGSNGYKKRTAMLRASGVTANFWEDLTDGPAGHVITDRTLEDVVARIDGGVTQRNIAIFGPFTDVDGNGKVDVFITDLLPDDGAAAFVSPWSTLREGNGDFGEIVYTQGPDNGTDAAYLAQTIAHEMSHLIQEGYRLLDGGLTSSWFGMSDIYIGEGLSGLAESWAGQSIEMFRLYAMMYPKYVSLKRLVGNSYLWDEMANATMYGFGALVTEYLFDQAGAVTVTGPGTIEDLGGVPWVRQAIERPSGVARLQALDGRKELDWYVDMAIALMITTIPDKVSEKTAADPRYRFVPATRDSWFNGFNGMITTWDEIGHGSGAIAMRTPWSKRGDTFLTGGMNYFGMKVTGADATLTVTGENATVALIRYVP